MTGIPDLGIRVDIIGRVLDPLLGVFLTAIQSVGIGACMHKCVWYTELTCISKGASKTDIVVGKVMCVCVCVYVCVRVCVCVGIQSRLVYRIGPLEQTLWVRSSALVCVDRWRGHSRCWAPLTTGVDIYPRVLLSAYCVLVAGPIPLQGTLNHWGRILPQGPTIQNNNQVLCPSMCRQMAGPLPLPGALNHWGRYLPQGPTICILCSCGGATPIVGGP